MFHTSVVRMSEIESLQGYQDTSGIKTSEIMSSGVVSGSVVLCAGVAPAADHLMVV